MAGEAGVGSRLLDRDVELAAVRAHATAAAAGAGRAVLITGPPGSGKTTLVTAARQLGADEGLHVIAARGTELHQDIPFGVVRELLSPLVARHPELLSGAAELAGGVLTDPQPRMPFPGDLTFTVMHGLFWFTSALAERRPIALVVDDLQWADSGSVRFLQHLATRVEGLPILLVLAARSGEASLSVAELAAEPSVDVQELQPLGPGAAATLVRSIAGEGVSDAVCDACLEATGGNPFYLREVAGEIRRTGASELDVVRQLVPRRIVDSIAVRMSTLPPECQDLARAVSILGDPVELARVVALTGLEADSAAAAADGLVAAGLLEPGRPLRFVHPVILAAVREGISSADASRLHRRAAELLAAEPGGLDRAAAHLLAVDPSGDEWVVETLRAAAHVADARGVPESAESFLRRAMYEGPSYATHGPMMLELATFATLTRAPEALELAQRALSLAESPHERLAAALHVGGMQTLRGEPRPGIETVRAALAEAGDSPLAPMARMLLLVWGFSTLEAREAMDDMLDDALAQARNSPDAPPSLCSVAAMELLTGAGTASEVREMAIRAWADGDLLEEMGDSQPFPHLCVWAVGCVSDYVLAEAWAEAIILMAGRTGGLLGTMAGAGFRAIHRYWRGDLAGAEADAVAAMAFAERSDSPMIEPAAAGALCSVLIERGRLDEAEAVIDGLPPMARHPGLVTFPMFIDARARLRVAQGRLQEALADTELAAEWERKRGGTNGAWALWRFPAVEALSGLGRHTDAEALAREALDVAQTFGAPLHLGLALRANGRFDEAIEVLEGGGVALEAARCRLERALEARDPAALHDALARADALGAGALASRARDALVASGARPRRTTLAGLRSLTPAERRVAEAAAGELSNRDIAETLFLTTKTVENHLTSIYRKLGISSRSQIAGKLKA